MKYNVEVTGIDYSVVKNLDHYALDNVTRTLSEWFSGVHFEVTVLPDPEDL